MIPGTELSRSASKLAHAVTQSTMTLCGGAEEVELDNIR